MYSFSEHHDDSMQTEDPSHLSQLHEHLEDSSIFDPGSTDSEHHSTETHDEAQSEIKLAAAGSCYWCSGTGVQWSGGENKECYQCGGSGIGDR